MFSTTAVRHCVYLSLVTKMEDLSDIFKDGKIDFDKLCEVENFEATDSCITVDLKCFCGVQCIKDVFIDCDED